MQNKILVIGDIHGRTIWKDILIKENPDKVIFLGDYATSHEGISPEQQLSNLIDILSYKEDNPDEVILLRGNHCLCELGYSWAECNPTEPKVQEVLSKSPLKERFLSLTQWIYIDENIKTVFSHAGISKVWMKENKINSIYDINYLEPSEIFEFTPDNYYDGSGYSITQPLTWIRPPSLLECNIDGWTQVVGHTPVSKIHYEKSPNGEEVWFCDNLGNKEYLVIDNNIFQSKTYAI